IGSLEPFVKAIPDFIDARLRLKSMKEEQAREVIINSCEQFNIKIDAIEGVDKIIDILKDDSGISLPYLQVYLYQLWQVDFARTYMLGMPWGYKGGYPALEFTIEEIQEFGGMKDVLFRFLEERSELIVKKLQTHSGYQPDVLDKVLNAMVPAEGTKQPPEIEREEQMVKVTTKAP